jgi:adenylate cyclase
MGEPNTLPPHTPPAMMAERGAGARAVLRPAADSCAPARTAPAAPPSPQLARQELERLLASPDFDATPRSRAFLRFVVEETLGGRQEALTQASLATHVFDRRQDFDPVIDPIVRVQAGRLRRSLERYYLLGGTADPVRIELPRGGYVPAVKWAGRDPGPSGGAPRGGAEDDWPLVVVGPFRSGGCEWADGEAALRFCERLAFEIGRWGDVRVALRGEVAALVPGPGEGARFALSGHLSSDGRPGWGAIARLVDCRAARQVWAEELRGDRGRGWHEEAASLIAARVASEHGAVARALWAERVRRPPSPSSVHDAILRSYRFLAARQPEDFAGAFESLQGAVAADPDCALAWVQLARLASENCAFEVSALETPMDLALSCAERGAQLDACAPRARAALAQALYVKGELAAALAEARRACEADASPGPHLDAVGWLLSLLGDHELGTTLVEGALARGPHHSPLVHHALWAERLLRGDFEASLQAAWRYRDPASSWPALARACSLGHLGKRQEAGAEVAGLLERQPGLERRGRALVERVVKLPRLLDLVLAGLGRAGLVLE